jgi:hypothetical protein
VTVPSLTTAINRVLNYITRTKIQIDIDPNFDGDVPLMRVFRSEFAQAEGWDVFDCGLREDGSARIEIQRLDNPAAGQPTFETDHAAWDHVVARARAGSALHLRALQMVDPTERKLIRWFCASWELPL